MGHLESEWDIVAMVPSILITVMSLIIARHGKALCAV